jgi:hypothetical protein
VRAIEPPSGSRISALRNFARHHLDVDREPVLDGGVFARTAVGARVTEAASGGDNVRPETLQQALSLHEEPPSGSALTSGKTWTRQAGCHHGLPPSSASAGAARLARRRQPRARQDAGRSTTRISLRRLKAERSSQDRNRALGPRAGLCQTDRSVSQRGLRTRGLGDEGGHSQSRGTGCVLAWPLRPTRRCGKGLCSATTTSSALRTVAARWGLRQDDGGDGRRASDPRAVARASPPAPEHPRERRAAR